MNSDFIIILIGLVWYLIGSIGGLLLSRKTISKTTNGDLVFLFTLGGIGGLITFFIALSLIPKSQWWDKEVFK
jgi:hypothetical protein